MWPSTRTTPPSCAPSSTWARASISKSSQRVSRRAISSSSCAGTAAIMRRGGWSGMPWRPGSCSPFSPLRSTASPITRGSALPPDRGAIERPTGLKIAHVEQEVAASDRPAIEFVLDGDVELRTVQAAIEDAERRDAAMELAELYASLHAIDGYRARARAAALMRGLEFQPADLGPPVAEFSGGWGVGP